MSHVTVVFLPPPPAPLRKKKTLLIGGERYTRPLDGDRGQGVRELFLRGHQHRLLRSVGRTRLVGNTVDRLAWRTAMTPTRRGMIGVAAGSSGTEVRATNHEYGAYIPAALPLKCAGLSRVQSNLAGRVGSGRSDPVRSDPVRLDPIREIRKPPDATRPVIFGKPPDPIPLDP